MSILTTGTLSGLGKYLFDTFGGTSYNRQISAAKQNKLINYGVDIILHTAFNSTKDINSNNLYPYLEDNVFLTKKLLKIPHKKFVFISTVDIYPKDDKLHSEKEVIDISSVDGIYAITKLMSESLVKKFSPNYLILRCTALLGKYSRKNSLLRIIEEEKPVLTLSPNSTFNYILHKDVSKFIKLAIEKDLQGIYNLASSKNITLSHLASFFKKQVNFGDYVYNVGDIDNSKAAAINPTFKKTSQKVISDYLELDNIMGYN